VIWLVGDFLIVILLNQMDRLDEEKKKRKKKKWEMKGMFCDLKRVMNDVA